MSPAGLRVIGFVLLAVGGAGIFILAGWRGSLLGFVVIAGCAFRAAADELDR